MDNRKYSYIALFILTILLGFFFYSHISVTKPDTTEDALKTYLNSRSEQSHKVIKPIPEQSHTNKQKVLLGEKLFNDTRLSIDGSVSCATCHNLKLGGSDHLKTSFGANHQETKLNTPTIFNVAYNFAFFWDGRSKDFTSQITDSLFAPNEMANTDWNSVLNYLNSSKEYRLLFKKQYILPITADDLVDALSEYNTSLITPNSRFDRYLKGENFALNTYELEGYHLFKTYGCISCHQGINIGGNMFQKSRVFNEADQVNNPKWNGRFTETHKENDRHVFKVPSLRNIALTAPYFHDGSAQTLEDAVNTMSKIQLATVMPEEEMHKIVAFLHTLTGEYKGQPL